MSELSDTREAVIMDITMLTKFADVQRLKDIQKSAFSRSRKGIDIDAYRSLRHPDKPALSRGFSIPILIPKLQPETKDVKKSSTPLQLSLQALKVVLLWGLLEIGRTRFYT